MNKYDDVVIKPDDSVDEILGKLATLNGDYSFVCEAWLDDIDVKQEILSKGSSNFLEKLYFLHDSKISGERLYKVIKTFAEDMDDKGVQNTRNRMMLLADVLQTWGDGADVFVEFLDVADEDALKDAFPLDQADSFANIDINRSLDFVRFFNRFGSKVSSFVMTNAK